MGSLTKYFHFLCHISVDEQNKMQIHIYFFCNKISKSKVKVVIQKKIYVLMFLISDAFCQFHYQYQSAVIGSLSCQTYSLSCNGWPGVGATLQMSSIYYFSVSFQSDRTTAYLLYITYHQSWAVVTPVKYNGDSKDLVDRCFWKMQNAADGINKQGLSNPHLMGAIWWNHLQNQPLTSCRN